MPGLKKAICVHDWMGVSIYGDTRRCTKCGVQRIPNFKGDGYVDLRPLKK